MNLVALKNPKDVKLEGITAECEFRDGSLASCTLTDAKGNYILDSLAALCHNSFHDKRDLRLRKSEG